MPSLNPCRIARKRTLSAPLALAALSLLASLVSSAQPATAPDRGADASAPAASGRTNRFRNADAPFGRARSGGGTNDPIARIRDEGLNRSQVMEIVSHLTDVIGPRLTGSPGMKRANEWTRDKLVSWGLTNAQLEAWGPFGYGWTLERFSAQVIEPDSIPIKAYPNAWSPGFSRPIEGDVILLEATNTAQLQQYKGRLKGAIVLASPVREVSLRSEPVARRLEATNLLQLANADVAQPVTPSGTPFPSRSEGDFFRRDGTNAPGPRGEFPGGGGIRREGGTNAASFPRRRSSGGWSRFIPFFNEEGVAAVLTPSQIGDAGLIFVTGATVPFPESGTNTPAGEFPRFGGGASRPSAYATNAPPIPAQITVAAEDYNRLVRMTQKGEKLKMAVDLQVQFQTNDVMAYNTLAEIPGTDLKDEIVMVGGHLDSWHAGTGATDNAAGVAVAMEAARILKAANLQPRRTVRVALWSGEEQGLLGSRAYVAKHFGQFKTNVAAASTSLSSPRDRDDEDRPTRSSRRSSERKLAKEHEYDKLSVYFNLDNGAGKIRGVYMQGNEAVRPFFRQWLEPFRDLGAETLTPANTGSTDHIAFTAIGLPGFQFLQDPLDYFTRTHHSNVDVFERIQPDDLKQASVIMAAFAYHAAMLDEKLPRKALE